MHVLHVRDTVSTAASSTRIGALSDGMPRSVKDMIQLKTCSPEKNSGIGVALGGSGGHCPLPLKLGDLANHLLSRQKKS